MKPSERKLYDYLEEYAQKRGEERFLSDEENSYTVNETFGIVKSLAEQLENTGVKSGDFVSVKADRTVKTILVFYALEIMGAVAVMHDPRERMTQDIRIEDGILNAYGRETTLSFEAREVKNLKVSEDGKAAGAVIFTSGSTGERKAVVLSQYNFINNSLDTLEIGGYREDDINILIVPLHHVFGLALVVTAVVAKHSIFVPRTVDTEYIAECMIKYKATRLNGVPSLYLSLSGSRRAGEIKSLRSGLIGGAPCSAEQFMRIEEKLKIRLVPVYGMSECIGIACGDYRDRAEKRCDNVGKVYSMNEVKISEEGEICVKSPAKALGYLQGGRITELEEWLHTGDLGYIDEEGYVHISGRKKDIIIRNGNNISSAKIESELLKLKYVESAAVVCGRDEKAGEVPCALVVLKADEARTEAEIIKDLQGSLTKIELPAKIGFAEELPLTSTGKTDKERIKKLFAE